MRKKASFAALVVLATAAPAAADINVTSGAVFNFQPFGLATTATYGQTFYPSAGASSLNSFSMFLTDRESGDGTLDLRGYVATWDGNKIGTLLYTSPTVTMNAAGSFQQFLFTPDSPIAVTQGQEYIAFLSASELLSQAENTFMMPAVNDVIAGNFVYSNNSSFSELSAANWSSTPDFDVYFIADFSGAVPEPQAWALLIAGFGLTGAVMRRRRAIVTA